MRDDDAIIPFQTPAPTLETLERFFAGEGTSDEVAQVRVWAGERGDGGTPRADELRTAIAAYAGSGAFDVARRQELLRKRLGLGDVGEPRIRRFVARERVSTRENSAGHGGQGIGSLGSRTLRRRRWSVVATVVLGVALCMIGWSRGSFRVFGHTASSEVAYTTYITANGQRRTITLPDGNSVVLNVASRLDVPTNYGSGNHVVRLPVGEALFTVSHHTAIPFTVRAGTVTAQVLGTSFIVRHYPTDTIATVAVNEGKVAVGAVVVTARQFAAISPSGPVRIGSADFSRFAFAAGVLTLDSMRLSSAIPELDRWYDADIRLGDSQLAAQPVEGNVTAGSLADLSTMLEWTLNVRVVRNGRVLTLFSTSK